jgi:hypothetical protein
MVGEEFSRQHRRTAQVLGVRFFVTRRSEKTTTFVPALFLALWGLLCTGLSVGAGEPMAVGQWWTQAVKSGSQNSIQAWDFSSRGVKTFRDNQVGFKHDLGLDFYTKVSSTYRDVATVLLQLYVSRIDNLRRAPGFYESEYDWELVPRMSYVNLHLNGDRSLNLKLGHYEIPYGLEVPINSNGTLRQFLHPQNLGLKADWGAALNGTIQPLQYEIGLSRGSGIELNSGGSPYALAGRIGNAIDAESFYGLNSFGLSFLKGEILNPRGTKVRRERIGVDAQYYRGALGVLGELSLGNNNGNDIMNGMVELNCVSRRETTLAYVQGRVLRQRAAGVWQRAESIAVGMRFAPDNHWAASGELTQELSAFPGRITETLLLLQLRYRY